jgi:hypothetical protein
VADALLTKGTRSSDGTQAVAFLLWERYPEAVYREEAEGRVIRELAARDSQLQRWDLESGQLTVREATEEACFLQVTAPLLGYQQMVIDSPVEWRLLDGRYLSTMDDYPIESIELEPHGLPQRIIQAGGLVTAYTYDQIRGPTSDVVTPIVVGTGDERVRGFESYVDLPDEDAQELMSTGGFESALGELVESPRQVARFRYSSHRTERPVDVVVWQGADGGLVQLQALAAAQRAAPYEAAAERREIQVSGSDPRIVLELQERMRGEPA